MGHIKKQRKKIERPSHPWEAVRIEEEKPYMKDYGLGKKEELWKAKSILGSFKKQAKMLIAREDEQGKKEEKQLIEKLARLGLIEKNSKLEDILGLDLKKVMERRLQTQVTKLGMARTPKQARQFIVHRHILVNNQKVSVPSYLVKDNDKISFVGSSTLAREDHPERAIKEKKKGKEIKVIKKEEKAEKTIDLMKEKKKEIVKKEEKKDEKNNK